MSAEIKYAYKRHNTWVYRRTYPKALQPILGSSLKQSLRTADAKQAKARVAELNQTFTLRNKYIDFLRELINILTKYVRRICF